MSTLPLRRNRFNESSQCRAAHVQEPLEGHRHSVILDRVRGATVERIWPRLERRRSGIEDRRLSYRGGRRAEDHNRPGPSPDLLCALCGIGLATIDTVSFQEGQRLTTYRCPVCGHFQHIVAPM
jgi:hypothetical protein